MFLIKLNVLCLLIINFILLCAAIEDEYDDDYTEMNAAPTDASNQTENPIVKVNYDSDANEVNLVIESEIELLSSTFKKTIKKIKEKYKKVDILFLIDASSSVGKVNFLNEISFVKRLLSDFNVSYNYTRTSLISFSSQGKIVSPLYFLRCPRNMNIAILAVSTYQPNISSPDRKR